jgi:hypothetical protein
VPPTEGADVVVTTLHFILMEKFYGVTSLDNMFLVFLTMDSLCYFLTSGGFQIIVHYLNFRHMSWFCISQTN